MTCAVSGQERSQGLGKPDLQSSPPSAQAVTQPVPSLSPVLGMAGTQPGARPSLQASSPTQDRSDHGTHRTGRWGPTGAPRDH